MWGERRRKGRQGRRKGVRWGRQGRKKEKRGRVSHDLSYKRRRRERREGGRERGKRKKEGKARGKTHMIPPMSPWHDLLQVGEVGRE